MSYIKGKCYFSGANTMCEHTAKESTTRIRINTRPSVTGDNVREIQAAN